MPVKDLSTQSKVIGAVGILALLWVASRTVALPVAMLAGSADILLGVAVIGLIGWWAASEADDDDGIADVVDKTTDRAEDASKGFLDGMSALIIGGVMVLVTVGTEFMDLVFGLVDIASAAPGVAGTVLAGVAGFAGIAGFLNTTTFGVAIVAIVLVVLSSQMDN